MKVSYKVGIASALVLFVTLSMLSFVQVAQKSATTTRWRSGDRNGSAGRLFHFLQAAWHARQPMHFVVSTRNAFMLIWILSFQPSHRPRCTGRRMTPQEGVSSTSRGRTAR